MVTATQIGRKLARKRAHAVVNSITPERTTQPIPYPPQGELAALMRQWNAEPLERTPEEIAEEDAVSDEIMQNLQTSGLMLRFPDVSGHD